MAPLPNVSKVVKVALVMTDAINTDIVTRFYLRYSGAAASSAELDTMAIAVKTAWVDNVAGSVNEALSLIRVEMTDLSSSTGAVGLWAGTTPGLATGIEVPVSAAVVVSYTIGRRYRGGHPRGYWCAGEGIDLANPQRWTSDFIGAFQNVITTFFSAVNAAAWSGAGALEHVNVSYFNGFTVVTSPITGRARNVPTPRGTPLVDAVVGTVARLRIGTQRRRLQYR